MTELQVSRDVVSQKENSLVDVVAIVKEVEEPIDIVTKKRQTRRRRIFLCDSSLGQGRGELPGGFRQPSGANQRGARE
jgi:hypothetical protein